MSLFWITDAVLSFTCFTVFMRLIKLPHGFAKLAAIGILLLSVASLIGTLKFAFQLQGNWPAMHSMASRLFGVMGLYILAAAWLDFSGLVRVRLPWNFAHVADGFLVFLFARWLNHLGTFQLVIGVLMNLFALIAALRCWQQGDTAQSLIIAGGAVLFIVNGLVIGGSPEPLFGPIFRLDAFHILFSLWAVSVAWALQKQAPQNLFRELP